MDKTMKSMAKIMAVCLMALLLACSATAQSDGGKKKKALKTEQTQESSEKRKQETAKKRKQEEMRLQQEIEKKRKTTGTINGHQWVDLGLPSGVKWALSNVGAISTFDYGYYFAWGETKPKLLYTQTNSLTYGKDYGKFSINLLDTKGCLALSNDAAHENWGGSWRMPTKEECLELSKKSTWKWTTQGGNTGYEVTGPNGNSIFLPACGYKVGTNLEGGGDGGGYWCSMAPDADSELAHFLMLVERDDRIHLHRGTLMTCDRHLGRSVRPVSD